VSRDARKAVLKRRLMEHFKEHPCADCGERDPAVLECDHTTADAHEDVSALLSVAAPLARLDREIARCEVVCANCHRRRTAKRARWRRLTGKPSSDSRWRRLRNVTWVYEQLANLSCRDCGLTDTLVLDFDHIREKRGGVLELAWQEYSLKTLKREMAACEVRCCNCHRRRTALVGGWFRSSQASLAS
jgi:hypothetical protein